MAGGEVHRELIRRSLIWLNKMATGRGVRGCEEVILDEGYVADAVAITGLQIRHAEAFTRMSVTRGPHVASDDYSFVFECKASRSDFLKTFVHGHHIGDRMKARANFHLIVTAKNVVKSASEIPAFWGHLEMCGAGLTIVRMPAYIEQSVHDLHRIAYAILRYKKFGKFSDECFRCIPDRIRLNINEPQWGKANEALGKRLESKQQDPRDSGLDDSWVHDVDMGAR